MGNEVLYHQAAEIYRWFRQGDSEHVSQKLTPRFRQRRFRYAAATLRRDDGASSRSTVFAIRFYAALFKEIGAGLFVDRSTLGRFFSNTSRARLHG